MTPEEKLLLRQALIDELEKEGIHGVEDLADKILATDPPSIQIEGRQLLPQGKGNPGVTPIIRR